MAVTVDTIAGLTGNTAGKYFERTRLVTFDNAYVTAGEPVAASSFRLHQIKQARAQIIAGFAAGFAHVDALVQTDGSLLLRLRAADGTEVANAADASTVTARVIVQGS